ncbi:hypothetical protein VTO73DRAFT_2637 [Trametes versicolor]
MNTSSGRGWGPQPAREGVAWRHGAVDPLAWRGKPVTALTPGGFARNVMPRGAWPSDGRECGRWDTVDYKSVTSVFKHSLDRADVRAERLRVVGLQRQRNPNAETKPGNDPMLDFHDVHLLPLRSHTHSPPTSRSPLRARWPVRARYRAELGLSLTPLKEAH